LPSKGIFHRGFCLQTALAFAIYRLAFAIEGPLLSKCLFAFAFKVPFFLCHRKAFAFNVQGTLKAKAFRWQRQKGTLPYQD
jgi:hypothetical protein